MALSRPDISDAMLLRKRQALEHALQKEQPTEILTNCPSCISGLSRNTVSLNLQPMHFAEKLAETIGGNSWQKELQTLLGNTEIVTF